MIELQIIDNRRGHSIGVVRLKPSANGMHVDSSVLPRHWTVLIRDMVEERGVEDFPILLRLEGGVVYTAAFNAENDSNLFLRRMRRKLARILSRRNAAAAK